MPKTNSFPIVFFLLILLALMSFSLQGELYFDENGDESPDGLATSCLMPSIGTFGEFSSWNERDGKFTSKFVDSFRNRYAPYISWELEKSFRKKYFFSEYEHHIEHYRRYLKKYPSQALPFSNILFRFARDCNNEGEPRLYNASEEGEFIIELFYIMGDRGGEYLKKLARTPEDLIFTRARLKDKSVIPPLSDALEKGATRERAIFSLGEFGKDASGVIAKLKRFYDDDDIAIKFGAMEAVLKISSGDAETVKAVKELCAEQTVHPQALKCLSLIPEPQSLTIILDQWRQSENADYRQIASRCADSIGEKAVPVIIDDFKKGYHNGTIWWARPFLLKYIKQSAVPLSQLLMTDDDRIFDIVVMICKDGGDDVKPEFVKLLDNPDRITYAISIVGVNQVTDHMIDNIKQYKSYEKLYELLSRQNLFSDKAKAFLRKEFVDADGSAYPSAVKLMILKTAEKDLDFSASFIPQVKDIVLRYKNPIEDEVPISLEEYLCWYMRQTKECDFAVKLFMDKTHLCSSSVIVEAAKVSGDAAKYIKYADAMLKICKDKSSPGFFKHNILILLTYENNLTDEDRMKILKWASENFSHGLRGNLKIHRQNIPVLEKMLKSENPKERETAYYLMSIKIDDTSWPDDFTSKYLEKNTLELLNNKVPKARVDAIKSLIAYKSPRGRDKIVEALLKAMQDPNDDVVKSALGGLERQGTSILPLLISCISSKDPFIASKACMIIGGMGTFGNDALPALAKAVETSPDWTLRIAALDAMGQIGPESRKSLPLIIKRLDDENLQVRESAGNALVLLGGIKKADPILNKIVALELVRKETFTDKLKLFQKRAMEGLE
ncbi:MAG TPA: hypothetical protein DCZ94_07040 [Lentisphaeria bacterium]|nr:MAG: hypothetical protein A2X48_10345 [Lentisphaerae bacterium GWF2_49_21]HBC86690.1 hypothetical protein [Lentisphaeria bacterium]